MLGRLLQVREGEATRAVLLFTYLFLVMSCYIVTKTTRDAIFLEKFSAARAMPFVEIASALCIGIVMSVFLRVNRRAGLRSLLVGTLLVTSSATVGFWFVARGREPVWTIPVLYVWASISGVLLPAQVWTLANQVMTTREAKRLIPVVGSGAISGGIVGGLVARAAARFGAANLLVLTAIVLACCPFLVLAIWRDQKDLSSIRIEDATSHDHRREPDAVTEGAAVVWRSAHLRSVAVLICLSSMVTTVVMLQYKAVAKAIYPDTNQLTAFFGEVSVYTGVLSLATQLFVSSRVLRRFGLGEALLVAPVALTMGSVGLLLSGTFLATLALRSGDQVLRYSIDRSSVELLYLPVPARQMSRAKALIDTAVSRIGDGVGSLLFLLAASVLGVAGLKGQALIASVSRISIVTLVLLGGWIAAAIFAKRHYVESLRDSIYEHRVDAERLSVQPADRSTADVLADALGADDAEHILYALALLEGGDPPISHPAVSGLLDHRSPEVRRKAIAVLTAAEDGAFVPRVERLLGNEDQGVRAEALVYLARYGGVDPLAHLVDFDEVHGSAVASAVAHFLARPGPAQNMDAVRLLLEVATSGDGPERHRARLEAARLIAALPDQFEAQLNTLLKDRASDVAHLAIRAAASVGKPSSVPLVVARLADADLAADAAETLVTFGNRAVPALHEALSDERTDAAARHLIPDILQRVGTPEAEQALVEHLLDIDPVLRLHAVSALNKLRQLSGDRRLEHELVETVLAAEILGHYRSYQLLGRLSGDEAASAAAVERVGESMNRKLERIFRLMKLLLPEHDLHSAYFGLQSGNPTVRANALEFLEHALPARLRTLLLPLIDSEVSRQERIRLADRMVGATIETSDQALAAFAASDELLRDAARKAERQLQSTTPASNA